VGPGLCSNSMRKTIFVIAMAGSIAGAIIWSYQSGVKQPQPAERIQDMTVATVGAKRIGREQFDKEYTRYLTLLSVDAPQGYENDVKMKRIVLNKMIEELFLESEADRMQVGVSPEELNHEIDLLLGGGDENEKARSMAMRNNITMEEWREKILRGLRIKKLLMAEVDSKVTVDDDEIKTYYQDNKESFKWPERVRALQIMVTDEGSAAMIRKDLVALPDRPESPREDHVGKFMSKAREKSISPDAAKGGDLGFFSQGQMPKEFEDAVFKLKVGQVSEVVETVHGFHIFMLVNREPPRQMTYDEARDKIMKIIKESKREKEFSDWIEKLKQTTKIEVHPEALLRR